ncbi:PHP domain-containing protein [Gryllotalpicola koreensis]|uniref:PHP domain-containing protein n=1 Tax=Gryllotalpicola koreensis TaxID=993086 RepID=A0ABP7ZYH1_9MICO
MSESDAAAERLVAVDCHVHTVHSGDSVLRVDQLGEAVSRAGLDVVCITDHHAVDGGYEALGAGIGARVVIGEEIRTPKGEIIGLFLTERIPYVLQPREVIQLIREQGGLVYVPHPLDPERLGMRADTIRELHAEGLIDVIEGFNAKIEHQLYNEQARQLAEELGLPQAAGSDAHDPQGVGAARVVMPDFDGPESFLRGLAAGRVSGVFTPHARRYGANTSTVPAATSSSISDSE